MPHLWILVYSHYVFYEGVWHHEGEVYEGVWHDAEEGHESVWDHEGEGYVNEGAIMVIDYLMLAMRSSHGMQNLLGKADAQRKKYILSKSKTTLQIINSKCQPKPAA